MRLLSFLNQVETTLAMLHPDHASGWRRRADYDQGAASAWHPGAGLSLGVRVCALGGGRYSVQAHWTNAAGQILQTRTFYCGAASYEWQTCADAVAEAMPEPVLPGDAATAADTAPAPRAASA